MSKLHTVFPQNKKDTYVSSDTVEFKLSFEGRKYKKNSLRVSGQIRVQQSVGVIVAAATNIFMTHRQVSMVFSQSLQQIWNKLVLLKIYQIILDCIR